MKPHIVTAALLSLAMRHGNPDTPESAQTMDTKCQDISTRAYLEKSMIALLRN